MFGIIGRNSVYSIWSNQTSICFSSHSVTSNNRSNIKLIYIKTSKAIKMDKVISNIESVRENEYKLL